VLIAHADTVSLLERLNIKFISVQISNASQDISKIIGEQELANAGQTAFGCDVDVLVVTNPDWLPYAEEFGAAAVHRYWEMPASAGRVLCGSPFLLPTRLAARSPFNQCYKLVFTASAS
jgi:hypothetical protein